MAENLSKEYFNLIRKVLREKAGKGDSEDRPLKKPRRRWLRSGGPAPSPDPDVGDTLSRETIERESVENANIDTSQPEVIDLESGNGNENNNDDENIGSNQEHKDSGRENEDDDEGEDEDFNSSEFEDVFDTSLNEDGKGGEDLSITIEGDNVSQLDTASTSRKRNGARRNVCSNEERKRRRALHMLNLLCLMVHCSIRNQWLLDSKLLRKLSRLVPDKTFNLLHPERDEEMPLRSTRKLLDGLKQCMEIWEKHWRVTQSYDFFGLYMPEWDDYPHTPTINRAQRILDKKSFIKQVIKGIGNRDIATQGFVALLRSCDVNARLIMSCQPPDFTNLRLDLRGSDEKIDASEASELFKYPIFWCEVWDKFAKSWITIDPTNLKIIEQIRAGGITKLEPRGTVPCKRNLLRYVIAFDRKGGCRDVTRRYARWYNAKVRKRRITKDADGEIWFNRVVSKLHLRKRMKTDDYEDQFFEDRDGAEGIPDNLQDLKNHPTYILEKDIGRNQVLQVGAKECGYLKVHGRANRGKTSGVDKVLKVYNRKDVITLKSARQWYMEGRILKTKCMCKKVIPRQNARDGEESEERLYSFDDTELYIPPLADDSGEIVKNTFGNVEVFVPSMIPQNCVLIESPHAIGACKRLKIPYARAVTSFKFERGKRAKAVISGVVVLAEFRESVEVCIDAMEYEQSTEEQQEAELAALQQWKLLLTKLRIKDELNENYGHVADKDADDLYSGSGGFFIPSKSGSAPEASHGEEESGEEEEQGGFLPQDIQRHDIQEDEVLIGGDESEGQMSVSDNQSTTSNSDSKLDEEYAEFMDKLGMGADMDD